MQVRDGSHLRLVGFRAVQAVVDRKEMLLRQLVRPFDQYPFAAAHLKCRSRH